MDKEALLAEDQPTPGIPKAVFALACLAVGYTLAREAPAWLDRPVASPLLWSVGACLLLPVALARGRTCQVTLAAAAVTLSAAWFTHRIPEASARHAWWQALNNQPIHLRADLLDAPTLRDRPAGVLGPFADSRSARWTASLLEVNTSAGWQPARGLVRVTLIDASLTPELLPRAGQRVEIKGIARAIEPPLNPGEPNRVHLAAQSGELGSITLENASLITPMEPPSGALASLRTSWRSFRAITSHRAHRALLGDPGPSGEPDEARALLAALILGDEEPELIPLRDLFARFGIVHVLSISGFHFVVMGFVALLAIRLTGDRGGWEPAILSTVILLYLAILPVNAPIWRSAITLLALMVGDAAARRYHPLAILAWVAILLALWRPMDLFSPGFQLSFLLTAALRELMPRAARAWRTPRVRGEPRTRPRLTRTQRVTRHLTQRLASLTGVSALCWLVALPPSVYHIGLVSVAGIITNAILVPILALLIAVGYVALAIGLLSPALAEFASAASIGLSRVVVWFARILDAPLGIALRLPAVSPAWTLAATAATWWLFWTGAWRERLALAILVPLALWLAIETRLAPPLSRHTLIRIDTLAVGDGTCHIVRSGRDAILWDCGSLRDGLGRVAIPRAARALGVRSVPVAIVTHPNLDHFNALIDARAALGLRKIYTCQRFLDVALSRPSGPEAYTLARLKEHGIEFAPLAAGDTLQVGDATLAFLSPRTDADWREHNEHSLVARLTHPDSKRSMLFTGDIQDQAVQHLRALPVPPRADIVEAPHHGSARDEAIDWLRELSASLVVQSTGPKRARDARWDSVRARSHWLTTCDDGASWVEFRKASELRAGSLRHGTLPLAPK